MTTMWEAAGAVLSSEASTIPIHPVGPNPATPVPASFAQERILQLSAFEPQPAVYNVPLVWRIEGTVVRERLNAALRILTRAHQALRLRFDLSGQTPRLHEVDFAPEPLSGETSANSLPGFLQREFDLIHGPLWRAALLKEGPGTPALLVVVFHQSMVDGASLRLFARHLQAAYTSAMIPLSVPFGALDFAIWQRTVWPSLPCVESSREGSFWRNLLAESRVPAALHIPEQRLRHTAATGPSARYPFALTGSVASGLQRLARSARVSNFVILLTALSIAMERISTQESPTIFVTTAARYRTELRNILGLLANILPLRLDLSGNPTVESLLQRVHDLTVRTFAHQALPFEWMLRMVPGIPPVEVQFLFNNTPVPNLQLPDAVLTFAPELSQDLQKPPLILEVHEDRGDFHGSWCVRVDLFESEFAARLNQLWVELLAKLSSGT